MTYCDYCCREVEPHVTVREEVYAVKGEDIPISASACTCPICGEDLWISDVDDVNLEKAYSVYREKHGLLSPKRIKEIRESYGLSQSALARLLGFGEKTLTRYENGSIQDEAHNNLLMLIASKENFKTVYENNRSKLTQFEQSKVAKALALKIDDTSFFKAGDRYSPRRLGNIIYAFEHVSKYEDCEMEVMAR